MGSSKSRAGVHGVPRGTAKKGRKSAYRKSFAQIVYQMALLGATDVQMAQALGVVESTFHLWKTKHPEFSESIKGGKLIADGKVAASLFERAVGYQHPDTHFSTYEGEVIETATTKYYPPDSTAAIFWLKNRRPDLWRDVQRHEHTGKDGSKIEIEQMSAEDLRRDMIKRGELDPSGRIVQPIQTATG